MDDQERRRVEQERVLMLEVKIDALEDKIDVLQASIQDLVRAWNTGKGASAFLIFTAKLAGACAVVWALLRNVKWSVIFGI